MNLYLASHVCICESLVSRTVVHADVPSIGKHVIGLVCAVSTSIATWRFCSAVGKVISSYTGSVIVSLLFSEFNIRIINTNFP